MSGSPRNASARSDPARAASASQPLRVLLADDDRDGAITLSTLLQLEGCAVLTVHGGQEALDVLCGPRRSEAASKEGVYSPPMPGSRAAASTQAKFASRAQELRVLVADDDRDGAITLSTLLQLEGYAVLTVHGGQEALDATREFKPHVVLLDIGMPKITGYEAARRLRLRYGTHDCPVLIAVTGWKQASDKILATLAGFDHHVAKPYEPAELLSLLAKLAPAGKPD